MIIITWVTVGSLSVIVELLGERFLSPTVSPTKSIYFEMFLCFLMQVLHPSLRELELSECSVSDSGLSSLCICKNLRKLDLNATKNSRENITSEGIY